MQAVIDSFKQIFRRNADKTAVIDHLQKRHYLYRELEDLSCRLAQHLRGMVEPGGRVAVILGNDIEIVLAYLACSHLEVTAVPINADFHPHEVKHFLDFAQPSLVITNSKLAARFDLSGIGRQLLFGRTPGDTLTPAQLPALPRLGEGCFPLLSRDHLALIMFTSGSTGVPKAIPIQFARIMGELPAIAQTNGFDETSRFYNILPMSYIGGWQQPLAYLQAGGSFVLDEAFNTRSAYRFWDTLFEHKVDSLWLTPSVAAALLAIGLEEEGHAETIRRQIKRVIVAMAALADDVKLRFEQTFHTRIQKALGITETLLCCNWHNDLSTPVDSVGKALPGVEIIIAGEDGKPLPVGAEGEIRIRGQWVFDGYWRQDDLTALAFDANGYFRTGDLGMFDAQGHLFITGRIKDMIKRSGLNVAPAEIEALLHRLPGVRDAAVVGVPDTLYGEMIVAFVALLPGKSLTQQEALHFCGEHLTALKVPARVHFIEKMPLNVAGKIDKRALKSMIANDASPAGK